MKISAIIPLRPDYGWRDYLWDYVKKRYEILMPQVELCIGIDEGEPFSRAKARNKAAKKAKGDVFIFVDADVIFDPKLIDKIISQINKYSWIIPFRNGYRLTKRATDHLLKKSATGTIQVKPADIDRNETGLGALMSAMTRSNFKAVSGFDERFKGWGCEDRAFAISLNTICGKYHRLNETIYHLWHQLERDTETPEYQKNLALVHRYKAAKGHPTKIKKLIKERLKR